MRLARTFLVLGLVWLSGCASPPVTPTPTPPPPTPTAVVVTPPPPQPPNTLGLWLPAWMGPETPTAYERLQERLDAFGATHGLVVEVTFKPEMGEAGLASFLYSAAAVAPAILPDVVALPLSDIPDASAQGLLHPLDGLLPDRLQEDVFPFARESTQAAGRWFGVPFVVYFEHLAFQPAALSDPPVGWNIILNNKAVYAFPTGSGTDILADGLIIHYLSAVPPGEAPERNVKALEHTLAFYETARTGGLIDSSSLQAATAAVTWQEALQGTVGLAHTTSTLWLRDRGQATTLRFGPIPTADSKPRHLGRGWAYALVTDNPERRRLAALLIEALTDPDFLTVWTQAVHQLPANRRVLERWPPDGYIVFANEALTAALLPPAWLDDTSFAQALRRAMVDVLAGVSNAETAKRTAVNSW
ncbi:MAG: hypothetical protein N2383_02470 [Caldilineales bacterium]|nr:hypothetical protein [Caldilineales bacterium]